MIRSPLPQKTVAAHKDTPSIVNILIQPVDQNVPVVGGETGIGGILLSNRRADRLVLQFAQLRFGKVAEIIIKHVFYGDVRCLQGDGILLDFHINLVGRKPGPDPIDHAVLAIKLLVDGIVAAAGLVNHHAVLAIGPDQVQVRENHLGHAVADELVVHAVARIPMHRRGE